MKEFSIMYLRGDREVLFCLGAFDLGRECKELFCFVHPIPTRTHLLVIFFPLIPKLIDLNSLSANLCLRVGKPFVVTDHHGDCVIRRGSRSNS